jgi:hypothetical protein
MGRPKAAQWRASLATARLAGCRAGPCPTTRPSPPRWAARARPAPPSRRWSRTAATERLGRPGRLGHRHPRRAEARARLDRQLLGRACGCWRHPRQLPPETTCRLDFAPGDAAQVDFGAGPVLVHPDGKPRRTWAFVMTLATAATSTSSSSGTRRGHLAGLPPPRLRVVRRRARARHHRQRQVRHHQGLQPRPHRAARLRRVRRRLRLQDRRLPAARPAEEGHRRVGRQVPQGQLPAAAASAIWPT